MTDTQPNTAYSLRSSPQKKNGMSRIIPVCLLCLALAPAGCVIEQPASIKVGPETLAER